MRQQVFEIAHGTMSQVEKNFHQAFRDGLFERWFPGFCLLDGCTQGDKIHFEGDALVHTGKVFAYSSDKFLTSLGNFSDNFGLLVAALVHDICKPQTRRVKNGKVTFYGHAELAAARCPEFARTLGMARGEAERLMWVVKHHMHTHQLSDPNFGEAKRLAFYQSPHWPVLRALQAADAWATWTNREGDHAPILYDFFLKDEEELRRKEKGETEA